MLAMAESREVWLVGVYGAAGAWVLLLITTTLGRRRPLATYAVTLCLLLAASALWPGSPLFGLWFRGRNPIDGVTMAVGVVLLACGVGVALRAVRSPCRAARSLGFGIGAVFAGAVVGCWTGWATTAWRDPWHPRAVPWLSIFVALTSAGHVAGWVLWAGAVWVYRGRYERFADVLPAGRLHELDRPRWRVRAVVLGSVTVLAAGGFVASAGTYYRVYNPLSLAPGVRAYQLRLAFDTLLLGLIPIVMWGFALAGGYGRWRIPGVCFACGYDLRGQASDGEVTCPECGQRNLGVGGTGPAATRRNG